MEAKTKIRTIIGKNALILIGRSEKELASQIFRYKEIREVRADLENLEVKLLMNYDNDYFKVLRIEKSEDDIKIESSKKELLKFYDRLLVMAAAFTNDELKNLRQTVVKKSN